MKRVYLVRHGQTDANRNKVVPRNDEPLNDTGIKQARVVSERIANLNVDKLIASDLLRAQQTAEAIHEMSGLSVETNKLFREFLEPTRLLGLGEADEEMNAYRKERNAHADDPDWTCEDGESIPAARARSQECLQYLYELPEENIVVVSHSMATRFLGASALVPPEVPNSMWWEVAWGLKKMNTGISTLVYEGGQWKVLTWNDIAHFAE